MRHDRSGTLKFPLQSLLGQEFRDFEARVVGDGCTDESEEVVASFGDRHLHWTNLCQNSGSQAAPNNEGLRRARGRYIAYLGHDDL
jgi:glycosyltransferase involved in cell wall biosynthesis